MEEERLLEQEALNDDRSGIPGTSLHVDPVDLEPGEQAEQMGCADGQPPEASDCQQHEEEAQPQKASGGDQGQPAADLRQEPHRNLAAEGPVTRSAGDAAGPSASALSILNSPSTNGPRPSRNGGHSAAPEDDVGVVETAELQASPAKKQRRKSIGAQKGGKGIRKEKGLKGGKSSVREHTALQTKRMRSRMEEDTIHKFLKLAYEDGDGPGDVDETETEVLTASWLASSASWSNKGKRKRVLTPKEEDEFEASVARALGFPADELSEAEAEAGLGGSTAKEDRRYVLVRNHILARWQCNVMNKVSLNQVR